MKDTRTIDQIISDLERRERKVRDFLQTYVAESFEGDPRATTGLSLVIVSPSLTYAGGWRLTRFAMEQGTHEPWGHTEFDTYSKAVKEAANEYGVNLDTVRFARVRSAPNSEGGS